jgi:hypothetical protein
MMSRRKWLLIVALIAILVCIVGVVGTHGLFWSFREMKYRRLLKSLPEPSGWNLETDLLDTSAYSPLGFRSYDLNDQYSEVVKFFKRELPLMDWHLLMEEEDGIDPEVDDYIHATRLLFTYQESFCLRIDVGTSLNEIGIQEEDRVWFHARLEEKEEADCDF